MATYTDTNGSIINVLTKAQYDSATKKDDELYFVTDENNLLSPATTFSVGVVKVGSGLLVDSTGLLSVDTSINISGNAATATISDKATKDGSGNIITSTYLPLSGGTMTGKIITNETGISKGYYLFDKAGFSYPGVVDNGSNLWIGSTATASTHHTGATYISSGYDTSTSTGNPTIYVSVPNASNTGASNYQILHTGNYTSTLNSTYVLKSGDTITGQIKKTTASSWIRGRDEAIIRSTDSTSGSFHVLASSKTPSGSWEIGTLAENFRFSYATDTNYNAGTNSTTAGVYIKNNGVLMGAAWNDYAEFRTSDCREPGRVICENGDDTLSLATERLQPAGNVISDTFGFAIGETETAKTPIAVSGRVLVYPYEDRYSYNPGDAVCAAPNGTVSKMTREEIITYPERIIGTVSAIPEYETWGEGNVPVNGRIWIKVK